MNPSPSANEEVRIAIRPPQFSLRTLLMATTALALTFGVLRWFDVSPEVGFFVLGVLVVAAVATGGLLAALLQSYGSIDTAGEDRPTDSGGQPDADSEPRIEK